MTAKDLILEEFENHKGEFVLNQSYELVRFIALGSDGHDYYYITTNGWDVKWNTCVGKLIYLKGKIDDNDYNGFISRAKLNHVDQIRKDFDKKSFKNSLTQKGSEEILLTDICWDLN
jgi:hypothetical protein